MASSSEPLTPDEIEQRQEVGWDDTADEEPSTDRPLDPDEIEQRQEVGWDDDDRPA